MRWLQKRKKLMPDSTYEEQRHFWKARTPTQYTTYIEIVRGEQCRGRSPRSSKSRSAASISQGRPRQRHLRHYCGEKTQARRLLYKIKELEISFTRPTRISMQATSSTLCPRTAFTGLSRPAGRRTSPQINLNGQENKDQRNGRQARGLPQYSRRQLRPLQGRAERRGFLAHLGGKPHPTARRGPFQTNQSQGQQRVGDTTASWARPRP